MSVVKTRGTNIWMFEYGETNSITIKYIYNGSANFIAGYDVSFDNNEPSNSIENMPMIGVEGPVFRARLVAR